MNKTVRSHGFTALGPLHEAFARLKRWPALGVAALLGALSALAFAPFHFTPALLFTFTAFVWMMDGARSHKKWGKATFVRGWAFGFGFFLVSMHWTASPFLVEPEKHAILLWMPLVLLPGGMALIWGAAMAMAGSFWSSSPSRVFIFSLFLALAEFTRGHLFGGFPWNLPGTTWVPGGAISQAASLGGVYWLTLLTIFVMSAPAALVDTRDLRNLTQRLLPSFIAVILVAFGWAWGAQRIAAPTEFTDRSIVLMDSGVPQTEKWEIGADPILTEYLRMMAEQPSEPGDIILWPEGAIPIALLQDPNAMDAISAYLGDRILIAGTTRYEIISDQKRDWYNSLAVMNSEVTRSGPLALYDKYRLVPMGELPAAEIIPFGNSMSDFLPGAIQRMATEGFQPGPGAAVVMTDAVPPFVSLICYEGLFPDTSRTAANSNPAEWIVMISNDAWFGSGMGPAQHYAQNRYRAIETGLPMVRVASRGASAIVDALGREVLRAQDTTTGPSDWSTVFGKGKLPVASPSTLYRHRLGAALFWLTISAFAGLSFLSWRR